MGPTLLLLSLQGRGWGGEDLDQQHFLGASPLLYNIVYNYVFFFVRYFYKYLKNVYTHVNT